MRILVAEDEEDIRDTYYIALGERGHKVTAVSDGEECLNIYRQEMNGEQQQQDYHRNHYHYDERKAFSPSSSPFDVVILDYRMPKKDGLQVAKEILELNPTQRIIFASAYVRETLIESVKELRQSSRTHAKAISS